MNVSKSTMKRIICDIKEVSKNSLESQGIYYIHDEDHLLLGHACIIGPEDTPYEYGYYFFKIEYPVDYPYSPLKVSFLSNDKQTRFHPNLYRNGKCCLSVLNTWRGDQWTSCQTLSSILLTICTIFTKNPLTHEPGINEKHAQCEIYQDLITYKNYEVTIGRILNDEIINKEIKDKFENIMLKNLKKNKDKIFSGLDKLSDIDYISCNVYNMSFKLNTTNMIQNCKEVILRKLN